MLGLEAAPVHGGSPAMEKWREERVGSLSRASLGHERRCDNRATVLKKRRCWRSMRAVLGHGRKRKRVGGGVI
jgi:hypothetical protein